MSNIQNPYNQHPPQIGQPMMPPPPLRTAPRNWKQRILSGNTGHPLTLEQERTLPNWLVGKSVLFFFIAFIACTVVWGYPMEMRDAIISSLSVLLFFYGCRAVIDGAVREKEKKYIRNVFIVGFSARLLWVLYCYFFFNPEYYGNTYGDTADVDWYMSFGQDVVSWIRGDMDVTFGHLIKIWSYSIDDTGYPIWLATGNIIERCN